MGKNAVIEIQEKYITLHKLIYIIFIFQRLSLQIETQEIRFGDTIAIVLAIIVCDVFDSVCHYYQNFIKIRIFRGVRFIQCLITLALLFFVQDLGKSVYMIVGMFGMFLVEYYLAMGVKDRTEAVFFVASIVAPVLFAIIYKVITDSGREGIYVLFDLISITIIFLLVVLQTTDFNAKMEHTILEQQREISKEIEKNEKIRSVQEKLKMTNEQLNMQKADLQKANKQIKDTNAEMATQAEVMHYIATSIDVPKISNQIADTIMRMKKLGFCAVYIRKDVYANKHPNYVIKTGIAQLQGKIRDNIEGIYQNMIDKGQKEEFIHENLKEKLPFLKDVNIRSVYMKVLGVNEHIYGLFMIGDGREYLFDENMSFYDTIIAQYNIAFNNVQMYNQILIKARKDGLTGINNRIYFSQLFDDAVERIKQENGYISVALFDIDKFKKVNDLYGHLAGDEVIKSIAATAEQCMDKYDGFVCRYGGEEFVAVLPDRKLEIAQSIVEELFEEICGQVVHYEEWDISISISVGLTSYPEVCTDSKDLLKRADWCMYYAKKNGRHQINVDDGKIEKA